MPPLYLAQVPEAARYNRKEDGSPVLRSVLLIDRPMVL